MKQKEVETVVETVIIGGGLSGLACANQLQRAKKDFLLITKNIGGRALYSRKDPDIELGGVYVNKDYFNLMPYLDLLEKFRVLDFGFSLDGERYVTLANPKCWKYYPKIIGFLFKLLRFRRHLNRARKQAEKKEFAQVIREDPLLWYYWNLPVPQFLKKHGYEEMDYYFGQPNCGTNFFTLSKNINTYYYMYLFISMIRPSYVVGLSRALRELTLPIEDKMVFDEVMSISKLNGAWEVKSKNAIVRSKNIVIAAEYTGICDAFASDKSEKFVHLPKPHEISDAWTYFVYGTRRPQYRGKKGIVLHPASHEAFLLWEQRSGGDIIYSKSGHLNLNRYYESYTLSEKKYWKTAIHLPGKEIIHQDLGDGLYLASDYNFSIMEDAFITGLYAANAIIKQ